MAGGFEELLEELFAPLGGVTIRRMFGGRGVFRQGMMFALVAGDVLYFKADERTIPDFEREASRPWTYERRSRERAMPYWRAPDRLLDEPDAFTEWARAAFEVAERKKEAKPTPKAVAGKKPAKRAAGPAKPGKRKTKTP